MNNKHAHASIIIKIMSLGLDVTAFFLALLLTPQILSYFDASINIARPEALRLQAITFALAVCFIAFFTVTRQYTKRKPLWGQILSVVKLSFIMLAIDLIVRTAAIYGQPSPYPLVFWPVALSFLIGFRFALNIIKMKIPGWKIPAVLIGDANTVTHILYAIASDLGMGYDPQGILMRGDVDRRFDKEEAPKMFRDIKLRNGRENYADFIRENLDHHFIISMETFRGQDRDDLLELLNNEDVRFSLVPMISQMSLYQADPLYFFGHDVMFIETKRYKLSLLSRFTKRTMDIVGASLGLLILGIPLLIIAALLKKESPNEPIFYTGRRVGMKCEKFNCWKFRSMASNSDHLLETYLAENPEAKEYWDRFLKLPDDPRVPTKITKFIRKTSIDELPQLWNVLKGDMSIVGPRPILEKEIELYGEPIKYYKSLRPGITGLWQVSGRSETSFARRVVWDRWYVRNWSLWGDIVIIIKTVLVVCNRKGAT